MLILFWLGCRSPTPSPLLSTDFDDTADVESEDTVPPYELTIVGQTHYWIGDTVSLSVDVSESNETLDMELTENIQWFCDDQEAVEGTTISFVTNATGIQQCTVSVENPYSTTPLTQKVTITTHTAPELADWTVLVYMGADNNLEEAALLDINEMEVAGSNEHVNIVVEIDRSANFYRGHGDWSGSKRFYIVEDATHNEYPEMELSDSDIVSVELQNLGVQDSGSPETIINFLEWGTELFPAQKTAIVFWNHGWSWSIQPAQNKGILSDDSTNNDISVAEGELEYILSTMAERGLKIDLLGMDACTMQSWELATVVAPYANTLVASQDYVNIDGWPYNHIFQSLLNNPSMNDSSLGNLIAEEFYRSGDRSISTIDLHQIPMFNQHFDTVSASLLDLPIGIVTSASSTTYSPDGVDYGNDHDFYSLFVNIQQALQSEEESTLLQNQIDDLLMAHDLLVTKNLVVDSLDTTGMSIYAPPNSGWPVESTYHASTWAQNHLWDDVLRREQGWIVE